MRATVAGPWWWPVPSRAATGGTARWEPEWLTWWCMCVAPTEGGRGVMGLNTIGGLGTVRAAVCVEPLTNCGAADGCRGGAIASVGLVSFGIFWGGWGETAVC